MIKLYAFNGCIDDPNEFGSFTIVSRKLNEQFHLMNILGNPNDESTYVIYPEVFATEQRWKNHIPYLACEYSLSPQIVIDKLQQYRPLVLSISNFAKNNLINSGYDKVETVYLGTDTETWYDSKLSKFSKFTYLTVNTSNDRSGYEKLIPAFMQFAKDKDVQLIIKDGNNPNFRNYILSLQCSKILYIDDRLKQEQLRELYNRSHLFLYTNNTTSFGMNPMDSVMCGTPCIVTMGSALKEFIPEWTQLVKIKTTLEPITHSTIIDWNAIGISSFPSSFLSLFNGIPYGERVIQDDIRDALEYSFNNYQKYLDIVPKHQDFIKENFTWQICARNILQKVGVYDTINR